MKKLISICLIFIIWSCSLQKSVVPNQTISQDEFLNQPFGFTESIQNFQQLNNPRFKTQKLLRKNKHYPEKTDTIYQFTYKKSQIFFYKTHFGKEFLLAGKVLNKQIKLKNDIHVGLSKEDFIKRFSDNLNIQNDSIQMIGDGTKYTFIFNKEKLYRINIDNYFD